MRQDEFNQNKVTNDKQLLRAEFGKIQKTEYSDSGDMGLHKTKYDTSLLKSGDSKLTNTTTVENIAQGASVTAGTTVSSATAATGVAATSAGIITVASTVTIGALGVFAVIAETHDYSVVVNSIRIIGDAMSYSVSVYDQNMTKDDYEQYFSERYEKFEQDRTLEEDISYPFVIKLYNDAYSSSAPADYLYNEGSFQNIKVGESYTITVSEERLGGETLYEATFVATSSYSFNDFSFPANVDLEKGTFDVYMDFEDENDAYSDFTLYLYDLEVPEEINYSFNLDKITGYQTVVGPNDNVEIDILKDWGYKFSFKENGETVEYKEGTAHFEDMYGRESRFNSFVFNKTYNYKEGTMDVGLDFVDDFNWYDNFILTLTAHYSDPTGSGRDETFDSEIQLEKTNELQTININEYEVNLETDYTYKLTSSYRGETITLAEETDYYKFTDNSGAKTEWNKFIFNKTADFLTNSFEVQLDYVDDFYNYYDFKLTLWPNGVNAQYEFDLTATTEVQTCTFDREQHYDYSFDYEYSYELTCRDYTKDEIISLEKVDELFKFADISGFNDFEFDGTYDYGTGSFTVRLDYDYTNSNYSNFILHIVNADYPDEPLADISLSPNTEAQSFALGDYELDALTAYAYTLTCTYKEQTVTLKTSEESFYFNDPYLVPSVSITFVNNEINYTDRSLWVQLDITDKHSMLGDVFIRFYGTCEFDGEKQEDYINSCDIPLEKTNEPQKITIEQNYNNNDIDFIRYGLAYNLYWEYNTETDAETTSLFGSDNYEQIVLTNSAVTSFNGVQSKYQIFGETDDASGDTYYHMYIYFDWVDENDMWSPGECGFKEANDGTTGNGESFHSFVNFGMERIQPGWYKADVEISGEDDELFNGNEWDFVINVWETDVYGSGDEDYKEVYREAVKPVFVEEPDLEILSLDFSETYMPNHTDEIENYELTVFPMFTGNDYSRYTDVQIIFEKEDGTIYTYSVDFSDYFNFQVNRPDKGQIDDINTMVDVPFKISVRYCTLTNNPLDPDSPIKSDPITIVVAENRTFGLSV